MNQTIHLQVTSPLLAIDARGSKFVVIPAGSKNMVTWLPAKSSAITFGQKTPS